jgi:ABC-type transport system involved in multi-copper enzyme maturation permease subunit
MNPFGSIITFDLTRMARRGRTFMLRCAYAMLLLFFMYINYEEFIGAGYYGGGRSYSHLARFAEGFFYSFLALQFVAIFFVTPVYVGGAIAEEKERNTLLFLLTTPLSDWEIIFAKLTSRLSHLALLLLTGLPVIALLQLFGGVNPLIMWTGFGFTLTTMLCIGCIGMYHSVTAAKPGDAVFRTYLTTMLILVFGGFGLRWLLSRVLPPISTTAIWGLIAAVEILLAVFFIWMSVRRLRRAGTTEVAQPAASASSKTKNALRVRPRPPVGDDAMLWLELRVRQKIGRFHWALSLIAVTCFLAVIAALAAFLAPQFATPSRGINPELINVLIRIIGTILAVGAILGAASEAANGVWPEREKQLLDSLLVTPITSREILAAKWWGAVVNPRGLYLMLGVLWIGGIMTGGLHPMALVLVVPLMVIYVWLAVALGLAVSLRTGTRARAQFWTAATTIFIGMGGPCCCVMSRFLWNGADTQFFPPVVHLVACQFYEADLNLSRSRVYAPLVLMLFVFYVGLFAALAYALWKNALLRFQRLYGSVDEQIGAGAKLRRRP